MKIEYSTCDICGHKIETSKKGKTMAKISILKYKNVIGVDKEIITETPFTVSKVGDISATEILEKVEIDLCDICSDIIEQKCLTLRKKNESKQENKNNK